MIQAPCTEFRSLECGSVPASVSVSRYQGESGVAEYHLIIRPTQYGSAEAQLEWLRKAYELALKQMELNETTSVFRRFFCSDLANQADMLSGNPFSSRCSADDPCAVSWVCQAPAAPAKVALWAYHIFDSEAVLRKSAGESSVTVSRGDLAHVWTTGLTCASAAASNGQTQAILERYESSLQAQDLSLRDNCIRTWFFVRDVDANYQGLVEARRDFFTQCGLTTDTHYIASTGIQGASADAAALVTMDGYAISGVQQDQIEYLSAPDYLSPTSIYGVTFERGVSVAYRDRKHILISGTASIDSAGQIVYPGDVRRQFGRTVENIEALLTEADAALDDVCMFIVYVRDSSDVELAEQLMSERFPEVPFQTVLAPVCRPGWLIEIECQAIVTASSPTLPLF